MIYKNQPYLILDKETLKKVGSITLGELIEEYQFTTKVQLDAYLVKHNVYHERYILIENDLDINYLPDEDGLTDKMFYESVKYQYYVNPKGEAYRMNKKTQIQEKIKIHYKGKMKSPYIYCKGLSNSGVSLRYIMAHSYFQNYRKIKNKSMYIVEALDGQKKNCRVENICILKKD